MEVCPDSARYKEVYIHSIHLTGFKSYANTFCGPFSEFCGIIGANGAGKSVLGDAISFLLQGPKGSRKQQVSSLVNQKLCTAQDEPTAQVTVSFAVRQSSHKALHIRRTLSSKRSELQMMLPGETQWSGLTEAALAETLLQYNVHVSLVDRFIVKQQSKAILVQSPLLLLQHIETLIGTSGIAAQITAKSNEAEHQAKHSNALKTALDRLKAQRQAMVPELERYKQYAQRLEKHRARKMDFLENWSRLLEASTKSLHVQEENLASKVAQQESQAQEAEKQANAAAETVKGAELAEAQQQEEVASTAKQLRQCKLEQAKLEVQQRMAQDVAQAAKERRKRDTLLERKLKREQSMAENTVTTLNGSLTALKEQVADAEEELGVHQRAAPKEVAQMQGLQGKAGQADSAVQRASKAAQAADSAADNLQQLAGKLKAVLVEKRASLGALEAADASRKLHAEGLQAEVQAAKGRVAAAMQELQGKRQRLQQVHITSQVAKSELEEIAAGQGSQGASALDAAILELAAPIGNARIRGIFYGRLHNLACVPDAAALEAVNAVVRETCAPASTFIVSDRAAAADVLAHLKSARGGLATCLIATEALQHSSQNRLPPACGTTRLAPLLAYVKVQASPGDCLQAVFCSKLGGWYVAEDRHAALAVITRLKAQRSAAPSIVTLQGELFKADGEVVSRGKPQRSNSWSQAYLLSTSIKPLGGPTCSVDPAQRAAVKKDLKSRLAKLAEEEAALVAQAEEAERQLKALQEQCAAKEAELALSERRSAAGARLEAQRRAVVAAEREVVNARAQAERAQGAAAEQHARLGALQEAAAEARAAWEAACSAVQGGRELLAAQARLAELRAQRDSAQYDCQEAQQALRRVTRRLAALRSSARAAEGGEAGPPGEAAEKVAARSRELASQAAVLAARALRARMALKEAKGRAVDADGAFQAAVRQRDKAAKAVKQARQALQSTQTQLLEQQRRGQQVEAALRDLRLSLASTADAGGVPEHVAAEAAGAKHAGRQGTAGKRRVILSDSDEEGVGGQQEALKGRTEEDSSSEQDVQIGAANSEEGSGLGPTRASMRGGQRSGQGRVWDEGQCEQMEAELRYEEETLKAEEASINATVVVEHQKVSTAVESTTVQLEEAEALGKRLEVERSQLEEERYARFAAALQAVNSHLSRIICRLSGLQGDAYCSYPDSSALLAVQGVAFHVRPDNRCWRAFGALSGGQQALASLALTFALQAAHPSPFYFFDELDAALDSSNAARVAAYIRSQTHGQYIVVTHKPQVYELATSLVGVYTCNGASATVTMHYPPQKPVVC